ADRASSRPARSRDPAPAACPVLVEPRLKTPAARTPCRETDGPWKGECTLVSLQEIKRSGGNQVGRGICGGSANWLVLHELNPPTSFPPDLLTSCKETSVLSPFYSVLSAVSGVMRVARRAGSHVAASAATARNTGADTNTTGSSGLTS